MRESEKTVLPRIRRTERKQESEEQLQDYECAQCTDKSSSRDSDSLATGEVSGCTTILLGGGRGSTSGGYAIGRRSRGRWGKDGRVVEAGSKL